MGDEDKIGKVFDGLRKSTITMIFGNEKKEISWIEVFNFNFFVNKNPQKRPYIYFNKNLSRMLV